MKKKYSLLSVIFAFILGISGCNNNHSSSTNNSDGGKTTVTLWAWGDEAEVNVFQNLIRDYNSTNEDNIYVNFVKKPSSSYYSVLETNLTGRQAPDLFYVGDSMIKRYAKNDYLEDLTNYIKDSDIIDLNDIWPTLMERYQFDVNTYNYDSNAPIWGLPKDIGPTVIFYNEDAFKAKGVTIISAKDGDNDEFVNYSGNTYKAVGYDKENNVFNNKIAMTFEENEALSSLLSNGSTNRDSHLTKWGFYSSWWFYAGWSVGGDVIQFKETTDASYHGGYWEFTLDDEIPNYRVSVELL